MLDDATALTAEALSMVLAIILLGIAYKAGQWVYFRSHRPLLGWAAGIAVFLAIGLVVQPARVLLRSESCRNVAPQDREICEAGDMATE